MTRYIVKELPAYYISYDEPNCEENWLNVKSLLPNAKRIHGVKGFDKAHKVCAHSCDSPRFLTIDGDNWLLDLSLDHVLDDLQYEDVVFSFKSHNTINGLEYGNGGLKCWNRDVLLSSNTHEHGNDTDFCWALRYYQVDKLGSVGVNNASPFQAWRAGYREGIKMSYLDGKPMTDPRNELDLLWHGNRSKLNVWMTVGRDVAHGEWAMLGARQGFYELYSDNIKNTDINDYNWFEKKWSDLYSVVSDKPSEYLIIYSRLLNNEFGLFVPEFDKKHSTWFKTTYINPPRRGLML